MRAGKSSKSKLLLAKFKSEDSLNGWVVRQGTYFQDAIATKYDGGMDARFEFTENEEAVFSGKTTRNNQTKLCNSSHIVYSEVTLTLCEPTF